MTDKERIEEIIREIVSSFSGEQSTKDWTEETIWFDAAPYACVGKEKAKKVFDEAFGSLKSCDVTILDMRTRIMGNAAIVCSVQKWDTVGADGTVNPSMIMRQSDYLEKQNGEWKLLKDEIPAFPSSYLAASAAQLIDGNFR